MAVRVSNPMRYLVPAGTAALAVVMFLIPVAFVRISTLQASVGALFLVACVLWLLRSAWKAPHALAVEEDAATVRSLSGERRFPLRDIRSWRFAVPDGPPTQSAPQTNAVLYITFADGTRFRGEVTADEASALAVILPIKI